NRAALSADGTSLAPSSPTCSGFRRRGAARQRHRPGTGPRAGPRHRPWRARKGNSISGTTGRYVRRPCCTCAMRGNPHPWAGWRGRRCVSTKEAGTMIRLSKWYVVAVVLAAAMASPALAIESVGRGKIKSVDPTKSEFVLTDANNKDFTFAWAETTK